MLIDPNAMRIAVVQKAFMENATRMYLQSDFTVDECVDTVTKQFHVGKKVTRELVKKSS